MTIQLPDQGFVFWPVGNGDSTTIRVSEDVLIQVDIHHMEKSEDKEDPAWPVVDELVQILPLQDGEPFLSVFVLSHPDQDHCQGFQELNERVCISELWMSPKTFREYLENEDLCDDAEHFHSEAMRRVKATIDAGGDPGSGDRIRIVGIDDLLNESDFIGFPNDMLSVPGDTITTVDAEDLSLVFSAFVHAPYKDDSYGERNDCSLAFQFTLKNGEGEGRALLMGDLTYPIIRRVFDCSDDEALKWNVLLAPHHCSKSAMYWEEEGDDGEVLKKDLMTDIGEVAQEPAYVVSSSEPVPGDNEAGDNPPHAIAKERYEELDPDDFLCTQEHPDEQNPEPLTFEVTESGLEYVTSDEESLSMSEALKAAGAGGASAPKRATGFGMRSD